MSQPRCVAGALCLALAATVSAQTAPSAPLPAVAAKAAPAADASDMERAQRAAANPLRIILEAARVKRRGDSDSTEAVDPAAVRRTAARSAAAGSFGATGATGVTRGAVATAGDAPAAVQREELASRPARVPSATAATAATVATAAAGAAAAAVEAADTAITALGSLPADLPTVVMSRSDTVAALAPVAPVPAGFEPSGLAPVLPLPVAAAPLGAAEIKPRLLSMIEPEVPQSVIDRLSRNQVHVDMVIRTDGSVAGVVLASPAPRQLLRHVTEALERWKFEPLPSQRTHRVTLVFNPAGR